MRKPLCCLILALLVLFLGWKAEDPAYKRIIERLSNYYKTLPQEKVYLQLDKPYYNPGDTIWFKAYLVDAMNHLPDSASKILYVDLLLPDQGKVVVSQTLRVDNGFTNGNIDLGDSLADGNYQVRAYTHWMRNFTTSSFYTKAIRVYKDIDRTYSDEKLAQLSTIADVQFFPEGGELVNGINCRVAFKAVNIAGNGIEAVGFIVNSKKDTITTFRSGHLGMGYFMFKPLPTDSYAAYVKDPKGKMKSYPLPKPIERGFVMALDNVTRKEEIKIFVFHNFGEKKNITVLAHQRGKVFYAADAVDSKGSFLIRVPKQNVPDDGIVHFTLFDQNGVPQCERLAFVDKGEGLKVNMKPNKSTYKPREKVTLDLDIRDFMDEPVEGDFSLAVTDHNQVIHEPNAENIFSYFLLSSDAVGRNSGVKGFIEQPGYYFDENNTKAAADLDVLLMTQGWRRFLWDDVLNKTSYDTIHSIETGLHLSGKVTQRNGQPTKEPASITLMLTSSAGNTEFAEGTANPDGSFAINNLTFFGPTTIAAQANKEKKLVFMFDSLSNPPEVAITKMHAETMWVENSVLSNYLLRERQSAELQASNNKLLKEITVTAAKYEKPDPRRGIMPVAKKENTLYIDTRMCAGATNAFQLLQSKIAGVKIYKLPDGYHALLRAVNTFGYGGASSDPLYIVDGMPVDASYVNSLTPCDIENIEVFKGPVSVFGTRGGQGVIAFFMRRGDSKDDPTRTESYSKLAKLKRAGYTASRQFYSPHYYPNSSNAIPDHRSTLFWAPSIKTDANGRASVTFWNTDEINTDVKIILEGISYGGKITVATKSYSVQ